jgi:hypothetical protein
MFVASAAAADLPDRTSVNASPEVWAQVEAYAARSFEGEAVCTALDDAGPLADALVTGIAARRDEVFDEPAYDVLVKATKQLDDALPGVYVANGGSVTYGRVDYGQLAPRASVADGALLTSGQALVGGNYPGWVRQTTDFGGCVQTTEDVFAPFAKAVPAASTCLRDTLLGELGQKLSRLASGPHCYCDDRATVEKGLATWASSLEALDAVGGPKALEALREGLDEATFSSSCAP